MPEPYQELYIKVSIFQTTQPSYQKLSINVRHGAQASIGVQSFNAENFKIGYYSKQCHYELVSALKNLYLTFPVDYLLPCAKFSPPTKGVFGGWIPYNKQDVHNKFQTV